MPAALSVRVGLLQDLPEGPPRLAVELERPARAKVNHHVRADLRVAVNPDSELGTRPNLDDGGARALAGSRHVGLVGVVLSGASLVRLEVACTVLHVGPILALPRALLVRLALLLAMHVAPGRDEGAEVALHPEVPHVAPLLVGLVAIVAVVCLAGDGPSVEPARLVVLGVGALRVQPAISLRGAVYKPSVLCAAGRVLAELPAILGPRHLTVLQHAAHSRVPLQIQHLARGIARDVGGQQRVRPRSAGRRQQAQDCQN
mmetsp:Transcript_69569/g.215042  ORF Transcript_69569/g.215042 Transcript_69569/m.215042 type:complete len:259 (-) Transcript_69569:87-863(-)